MRRIALAACLAAAPAAAQQKDAGPLAGVAVFTEMSILTLEDGGELGRDLFVDRTLELFDLSALTPDWTARTEGYGAAEEIRILRVTPYPSDGTRPDLSAVDFAVLYENDGFLCGYAIWEPTEGGPAMRRFQFGVADPDVMLSDEPGRSEALRGIGCTVLPDDMPGGPLR